MSASFIWGVVLGLVLGVNLANAINRNGFGQ